MEFGKLWIFLYTANITKDAKSWDTSTFLLRKKKFQLNRDDGLFVLFHHLNDGLSESRRELHVHSSACKIWKLLNYSWQNTVIIIINITAKSQCLKQTIYDKLQNDRSQKGLSLSWGPTVRQEKKSHVHNLKHGKVMIINRLLTSCETVKPYLAQKWIVMRSRWLWSIAIPSTYLNSFIIVWKMSCTSSGHYRG